MLAGQMTKTWSLEEILGRHLSQGPPKCKNTFVDFDQKSPRNHHKTFGLTTFRHIERGPPEYLIKPFIY